MGFSDLMLPDIANRQAYWRYFMDHYVGGADYPAKDNPLPSASYGTRAVTTGEGAFNFKGTKLYLWQHPMEWNERFGHRLSRATYIDVISPIVDLYVGTIGKPQNILIEESQEFDEFLDDCDLQGTSFLQFMARVRTNAAVYGATYVLVDSTRSSRPVVTQRDYIEQKVRPYLIEVTPEQLVSYRKDRYGTVVEVAFVVNEEVQGSVLEKPKDPRTQLRVWTRDSWAVYYESEVTGSPELVDGGSHSVGRVPFIPVFHKKECSMHGKSLVSSAAKIGQLITNWVSNLDEAFENQMFAVPVLKSRAKPSEVGVGTTTVLHLNPEDNEDFKYVAPDTAPFEASWASVFRMIGFANKQMGMNPSAITDKTIEQKSGVAKAWDYHEAAAKMTDMALNEQEATKNILYCVGRWMGFDRHPSAVYSTRYDLATLKEDIDNAKELQTLGFPDEVMRALGRRIAQKGLPSLSETEAKACEAAMNDWSPRDLTEAKAAPKPPVYKNPIDESQPSKKQQQGRISG